MPTDSPRNFKEFGDAYGVRWLQWIPYLSCSRYGCWSSANKHPRRLASLVHSPDSPDPHAVYTASPHDFQQANEQGALHARSQVDHQQCTIVLRLRSTPQVATNITELVFDTNHYEQGRQLASACTLARTRAELEQSTPWQPARVVLWKDSQNESFLTIVDQVLQNAQQ